MKARYAKQIRKGIQVAKTLDPRLIDVDMEDILKAMWAVSKFTPLEEKAYSRHANKLFRRPRN